jgi:hypothetical protein
VIGIGGFATTAIGIGIGVGEEPFTAPVEFTIGTVVNSFIEDDVVVIGGVGA